MHEDIRRPVSQEMVRPTAPLHFWQNSKRIVKIILGAIIAVVVVVFLVSRVNPDDYQKFYQLSDGYQAVFLNNGETYFGKVSEINRETLTLTNVYYLQSQAALQSGPQPEESEVVVVKLGGEIHGPENQLIIPKTSISYLENLKETSAIVRAISKSGE